MAIRKRQASGTKASSSINIEVTQEPCDMRILRALRQIIRAVDIYSRRLHHDHQVTTPQLICLYSLRRGGAMTLTQLSQSVNLSVSTVNGIMDRLEARQLIQRQRSEDDRRKVFANLTDQGRALTEQAPSLLQDRLSVAIAERSPLEQTAIALSLERVVEMMGAEHLDASPNLLSGMPLTETNGEPTG